MTSRMLVIFGWSTLLVGIASAQEKAPVTQKPSLEAQIQQALEVSNDDLPKAIKILEKGLERVPDDRKGLFLLGAMTTVQGEEVKSKVERSAMFHKATATFAKLSSLYKNLNRDEIRYQTRSRINEARALAIDGKVKESFEFIKLAIAAGYDSFEVFDIEPDFEAVRELPEFKAIVLAAYKAMVTQEIAQFKPFPFTFKLKDTDDRIVTQADFKGKVTMVDVWGTWCPACLLEIPHFVEIYRDYKDKGLAIVGINCNEQGTREEVKKKIKDFNREHKIEYPCLINDETTEEKIPDFQGYPTAVFLDRTGKVRLAQTGYLPKAKVEVIISMLLAEGSNPAKPNLEK